jgi:hypothetical protein
MMCTQTTYTKISASNRLLAPRTERNQTLPPGPESRLRVRLNTEGQRRSKRDEIPEDENEEDIFEEEKGITETAVRT